MSWHSLHSYGNIIDSSQKTRITRLWLERNTDALSIYTQGNVVGVVGPLSFSLSLALSQPCFNVTYFRSKFTLTTITLGKKFGKDANYETLIRKETQVRSIYTSRGNPFLFSSCAFTEQGEWYGKLGFKDLKEKQLSGKNNKIMP